MLLILGGLLLLPPPPPLLLDLLLLLLGGLVPPWLRLLFPVHSLRLCTVGALGLHVRSKAVLSTFECRSQMTLPDSTSELVVYEG